MKTVGEILQLSSAFLEKKKVGRSKRVAEEILAHIMGVKRLDIYLNFEKPIEENEIEVIRRLVQRAAEHEPIEYLVGSTEFYHCSLDVTPDVLIPRKETELLVERALQKLEEKSSKKVVDLCTGSGCIAIAIKKQRPDLEVIATDISEKALEIAKRNSEKNGVQIQCLQGDLTDPIKGQKFDCILSNPPYVSENEYSDLEPSVRNFEPICALVAKEEGLEYYMRLNKDLPALLEPKGFVLLEIGIYQAEAIQKIFYQDHWKVKEIFPDLTGRNRFFFLEIQ